MFNPNSGQPTFNDVEGTHGSMNVDMSASFKINEHFSLTFEGVNLTDEYTDQYIDSEADRLSVYLLDEHLRQVLAAYALLRDPARRADYDRLIAHTADTQPHSPAVSTPPDHPLAGPVQIPITHRRHHTRTTPVSPPPLWAGPVRCHR